MIAAEWRWVSWKQQCETLIHGKANICSWHVDVAFSVYTETHWFWLDAHRSREEATPRSPKSDAWTSRCTANYLRFPTTGVNWIPRWIELRPEYWLFSSGSEYWRREKKRKKEICFFLSFLFFVKQMPRKFLGQLVYFATNWYSIWPLDW